jgi:catechol 2,3-dioxygenase-like lactoylglutathione lyase family enzyme
MIDHISLSVSDLAKSTVFYKAVLSSIGFETLAERAGTVGFGKTYPEFWLNHRPKPATQPAQEPTKVEADSGMHIALRTKGRKSVERFYHTALQAGATSDGAPGFRSQYSESYYAAFIRDPEGNRIEIVTFISAND